MHPTPAIKGHPEPSFAPRTTLSPLAHSPHSPPPLCPRQEGGSIAAVASVRGGRARHARQLPRSTTATRPRWPSSLLPSHLSVPPATAAHPCPVFPCSGSTRETRRRGDRPELGTELQPTNRTSPARTTSPVGPVKPPPPSATSPPSQETLGEPPRARLRRLPLGRRRSQVVADAVVAGRWILIQRQRTGSGFFFN